MPALGKILDEIGLAESLFAGLGDFWTSHYGGRDQVRRYCRALADGVGQVGDDIAVAFNCINRNTVPTLRRFRWHRLAIRRSDRDSPAATLLRYGDGRTSAQFGGGYFYGTPGVFGDASYAHDGVADVPLIFSRMEAPGTVLVDGIDYRVERDRIVFLADPFDDPAFAQIPIDGDDELSLWLYRAGYDEGLVRDHVGFKVGLALPSSPAYLDLCNATLDAVAGGTAVEQLSRALAAATGTPIASADGEVVEEIGSDFGRPFVATDRAVYPLGAGASASVAPGDVLSAGDPLSDGFALAEFNRGVAPGWLKAVALDGAMLARGAGAQVVFPKGEVPLSVSEDGGYTRAEFPLGGRPEDVRAFWDAFHDRGVAAGRTLAMCLDRRPAPYGQPTAGSLPAAIDPLDFLVSNVLRGHAAAARIRVGSFGPSALGLGRLSLLRRISPPHVCLFIEVEAAPLDDSVILDALDEGPIGYGYASAPVVEAFLSGPDSAPTLPPRLVDFF